MNGKLNFMLKSFKFAMRRFGFVVKVSVNALISLLLLNVLLLTLSALVNKLDYISVWSNFYLFTGLIIYEVFHLKRTYFEPKTLFNFLSRR